MTTIRMLVDVAYPAGLLRGNQVYDLPAGEAEAMVIIGWAEYTDDDPLQVIEAAVVAPRERAVAPRQRAKLGR